MLYLIWIGLAIIIATYMGASGYHKKSLSASGSIAASVTGFLTFSINTTVGIVLIAFFLSSSKLTKYGSTIKKKIEAHYLVGGQRDITQVISNSFSATILLLMMVILPQYLYPNDINLDTNKSFFSTIPTPTLVPYLTNTNPSPSSTFIYACLIGAIAHYCCCNADTWSSEIGSLAKSSPILITTFQRVPTGTNGGCSIKGTIAGILGGAFIGAVTAIMAIIQTILFYPTDLSTLITACIKLITFGVITGTCGTVLDSLLGAILQCSVLDQQTGKVLEMVSWDEYNTHIINKNEQMPRGQMLTGFENKHDDNDFLRVVVMKSGQIVEKVATDDNIDELAQSTTTTRSNKSNDSNVKGDDVVTWYYKRNEGDKKKWEHEPNGSRYKHICGYPILDNHQVNMLSSTIIGFGAFFYVMMF